VTTVLLKIEATQSLTVSHNGENIGKEIVHVIHWSLSRV